MSPKWPAVERRHGGIQLPGDGAHRGGTDRPAQDGQQGGRHLAGREAEQKAGEDHAIDVLGAPRIGTHDLERAEGPGTRHRQLEVAELGQQVAVITAVAAIRLAELGHTREMLVDQLVHPALEELGHGLPGATAIVLAPFDIFGLHRLHHPTRGW